MNTFQTLGICISSQINPTQKNLIQHARAQYGSITWFLKGKSVELFKKPQILKELYKEFGAPLETFACSTACESYKISLEEIKSQKANVAGLGTWISLVMTTATLDFSSYSQLPEFVAVDAHPFEATDQFIEQLDLAFAATAFDLEPTVLLFGDAQLCLSYPESSAAKRLKSAHLYGIEKILSGDNAVSFLSKARHTLLAEKENQSLKIAPEQLLTYLVTPT